MTEPKHLTDVERELLTIARLGQRFTSEPTRQNLTDAYKAIETLCGLLDLERQAYVAKSLECAELGKSAQGSTDLLRTVLEQHAVREQKVQALCTALSNCDVDHASGWLDVLEAWKALEQSPATPAPIQRVALPVGDTNTANVHVERFTDPSGEPRFRISTAAKVARADRATAAAIYYGIRPNGGNAHAPWIEDASNTAELFEHELRHLTRIAAQLAEHRALSTDPDHG